MLLTRANIPATKVDAITTVMPIADMVLKCSPKINTAMITPMTGSSEISRPETLAGTVFMPLFHNR